MWPPTWSQVRGQACPAGPCEQHRAAIVCLQASSEVCAHTLVALVAAGGYFIGTVPDGKRIAAHLSKASGRFTSPCLNLTQKFEVRCTATQGLVQWTRHHSGLVDVPLGMVRKHQSVSPGHRFTS
jgi:hypothetical protein